MDLIETLREHYIQGNRYNLLTALMGTLARRGYSREDMYDIYRKVERLDDEDRSAVIDSAFERVHSGLPVRTLRFMSGDSAADELSAIVDRMPVFESYLTTEDLTSSLETQMRGVAGEVPEVDLSEFTASMDRSLTPISYDYALSRGLTVPDIEKYEVRCGIGEFSGRIVFPVRENGRCVMIVGRSYVGHKRKYFTYGKRLAIWGYDEAKESRSAIVCEGILSAISAFKHSGIPAVAVLGSNVDDSCLALLSRFDLIYLCFDPDVSSGKVNKIAVSVGKDVRVIKVPSGKDPNDMDSSEFNACVRDSNSVEPLENLLSGNRGLQ